MAFKMKGSAFKLNNVATKSALKQAEASPMKDMGEYSLDIDEETGVKTVKQVPRGSEETNITTGGDIRNIGRKSNQDYYDALRRQSKQNITGVGEKIGVKGGSNIMEQEIQDIVDSNVGLSPGDEGYIEMTPKQKEFQKALIRRLTISQNKPLEGEGAYNPIEDI